MVVNVFVDTTIIHHKFVLVIILVRFSFCELTKGLENLKRMSLHDLTERTRAEGIQTDQPLTKSSERILGKASAFLIVRAQFFHPCRSLKFGFKNNLRFVHKLKYWALRKFAFSSIGIVRPFFPAQKLDKNRQQAHLIMRNLNKIDSKDTTASFCCTVILNTNYRDVL